MHQGAGMPNQERNGRNVAVPEENQQSWRPQDDGERNRRSMSDSDDRHWDDRSQRMHDDRSTERYGQGQSGYGAGRSEGDRGFSSRNQGSMGDYGPTDRGTDERFVGGRSGQSWSPMDRDRGSSQGSGNYGHSGQWRDDSPMGGHRNLGGSRMIGEPRYGGGQQGYGQGFGQQGFGGFGGQGYGTGFSDQDGSGYGHQPEHEMAFRGGQHGNAGQQGQQGYGQQQGQQRGGLHRGKGPAGYVRSDDRIREMVCDCLTDHDEIDASHIEVSVKNGEVTLSGAVEDRRTKRMVEDIIDNLSGVKEVINQLRITDRMIAGSRSDSSRSGSGTVVEKSGREQEQQGMAGDKRHRA